MDFEHVVHDWLSKRKISDVIAKEFGIHGGYHTRLGECIVIPVHNESGILSFHKYRRSPLLDTEPKYLYDKGGSLTLYGYWKAKVYDTILITEGEMDSLVAWSHNIPAVSSTGGAKSLDDKWSLLLERKNLIICFDNDKAGGEGMVKALKLFPEAKIVFIPDKPGVKDITDYVMHGGDLETLLKTGRKFHNIESVKADRAERVALWKSTWFHDAYILEHSLPERKIWKPGQDTRDSVARAKSHPIDDLLDFNSSGSTKCPFHSEKEASLHYYREQNRCWCFGGCGRGYDVIDIYMKLNNVGFKEAIKALQ